MSYIEDDESTIIDDLNEKIDNLQSQLLDIPSSSPLENNETGQSYSPGSNPVGRIAPKDTFSTDLGDISGATVIDFDNVSSKNITANVVGAVQITFANIPPLLTMQLRLYIRVTDPVITIDGTIVSGTGSVPLVTTAIGDFLDMSLESTDQVNVTVLSTKKNDESGDVAPDLPQNVNAIGNSATTIRVIWDTPALGTAPITYDVAWSTSSLGDSTNGPTTPEIGSPDNDISGNIHEITGLTAATTYYVWIRAKNSEGNSNWLGPYQTNTDGTSSPAGVNFAVPGGSVEWNSITCTWDQPGTLRFTLKRINTVTGETELLQNFSTADDDIVDNKGIQPDTNYDYELTIYNEFGAILGLSTVNVDSDSMPTPTVVFENVGTKLKFTITLPANVNIAYLEWSLDDDVDEDGFFTVKPASRQIVRPIGETGETDVIFETPILLADTLYYGHAKLQKNSDDGPFSTTDDATTGSVSPPSKPGIEMSSPDVGEVRIKLDFNDGTSTGEWIVVSYRDQASVGPYTPFETYFRDNPPADDLDDDEDEIEIIRGGFTGGQQYTFRAEAFNQAGASAGGADTDNVLVDSS